MVTHHSSRWLMPLLTSTPSFKPEAWQRAPSSGLLASLGHLKSAVGPTSPYRCFSDAPSSFLDQGLPSLCRRRCHPLLYDVTVVSRANIPSPEPSGHPCSVLRLGDSSQKDREHFPSPARTFSGLRVWGRPVASVGQQGLWSEL